VGGCLCVGWAKTVSRTPARIIFRVGQNRIFAPYMTVYLVKSLPKMLYVHRMYMVLANPTLE